MILRKKNSSIFKFVFLAIVTFLIARNAKSATADLILVNGKIITVYDKDSIAKAIAIQKGKIVAVGSNEEIYRLKSVRSEKK